MRRALVLFGVLFAVSAVSAAPKKAPSSDFAIPVTLAVIDSQPWVFTGLEYKFDSGLRLSGQVGVGRTDSIDAVVFSRCRRAIPVHIGGEQKAGFVVTLTIPLR